LIVNLILKKIPVSFFEFMNDNINLELYNEEEWINKKMTEFDIWWNYIFSFFEDEKDDDDDYNAVKISADGEFEGYQNQSQEQELGQYEDPYTYASNQGGGPINQEGQRESPNRSSSLKNSPAKRNSVASQK